MRFYLGTVKEQLIQGVNAVDLSDGNYSAAAAVLDSQDGVSVADIDMMVEVRFYPLFSSLSARFSLGSTHFFNSV